MCPSINCEASGYLPRSKIPIGRLFQLSPTLVATIRTIGCEFIVQGSAYCSADIEALLEVTSQRQWPPGEEWVVFDPAAISIMERNREDTGDLGTLVTGPV